MKNKYFIVNIMRKLFQDISIDKFMMFWKNNNLIFSRSCIVLIVI